MITIQLDTVNIEVNEIPTPAGKLRMLIATDAQSGLRVVLPLDENAARVVAAALDGRPAIEVPTMRLPS